MSYHLDSKGIAIDKLATDFESFQLGMGSLPKKGGVQAVHELYALQFKLLMFAHNPNALPAMPDAPEEPNLSGLSDEQAEALVDEYNKVARYFKMIKDANEMKVDPKDFMMIADYINTYKMALRALPAVKSFMFKALTKNIQTEQQKAGIMAALSGGDKE